MKSLTKPFKVDRTNSFKSIDISSPWNYKVLSDIFVKVVIHIFLIL